MKKKSDLVIAGDESLSPDELNDLIIDTGDPKDSIGMRKKAIDEWAIESFFYQEALTKFKEEEIDIEKQVNDYRKSLINHLYSTKIIEANLDTNVSLAEIQEYYNENKDNFILKDNIVKVNYFKIPLKAQPLEKMKRLLYSTTQKDKDQLISLAAQYAENYFVNDSTWLYLDEVKKEVPKLREQDDIYIFAGRVIEISDDAFYYFLRIREVKNRNSVSPINFEKQNIKKVIINRRKTQLINQYKKQLLEKAVEEKRFRIQTPAQ
ncbi:MAG TPA: hypothetical protein PLU73_02905 [Bacteroidia bacterium]|nr:hypothetical protein [Bacteroidia bacterium]